jgi:hypothetical protein
MKKVLFFILIILILAGLGGIYYFNAVFLPAFLRKTIQEKGREFISRDISFDSIEYKIGKGLLIKNLRIMQKDQPDNVFFQAQEISSAIPLIPLIKEKKIILPQITAQDFSSNIFRIEKNEWNFSDLFIPKKGLGDSPYQILVGKIILKQGQVSVSDITNAFEPATLSFTHIQAGLSLPSGVSFSLTGEIPDEQIKILLKGSYNITQKSIDLNVQAVNINLVKTIFPFLPNSLPLDKAFVKHTDLSLSWQDHVLECRGDMAADIQISLPNFSGNGSIESRGAHLLVKEDLLSLNLNNVLMDPSSFQTYNTTSFSGQMTADNLQFKKEARIDFDEQKKDYLTFSASNATIKPEMLKINTASISSENILLTTISFKQSPDEFSMETALSSQQISASQNGLHLSGNLTVPSLKIAFFQNTWTVLAPFRLQQASAERKNAFSTQTDLNVESLEIIGTKNYLNISGTSKGAAMTFAFPNERSGSVMLESISFQIATQPATPGLQYAVNTTIKDGLITKTIPDIGELKNIKGKVSIVNDKITLDDVLMTAKETAITIKGDLKNFSQWNANLSLSAKNVAIPKWIHLIQRNLDPYGLTINGTTDLTVFIKGPLAPPGQPRFSADAQIKTADVSSSKYPYTFNALKGSLKYNEDSLAWNNMQFEFQKNFYESTGSLRRFNAPVISLQLKGRDMILSLSAESVNGIYEVSRADLKTKLSSVSASGTFHPDMKSPYTEARVQGYIVLSDLEQLHPFIKEKIAEWDIRGRGNIALSYAGKLADPLNAHFSLTYQSDRTSIKNFRFDNLTIKTTQPGPNENIFDIGTQFHDGKVVISGNIRFQKDFPFRVQANASGVDLAKLKNDLPIKDQRIEGLLTANMFLQGDAKKTSTMTGQGAAKIEKGYFVKPNFLKGIISLILNQEYQDVVFTDAKAKLFIRDNRIRLADIFVKSSAVDLTGFGWIDIEKNIDFTITPNFRIPSSMKTDLIKSSTENIMEKYLSIRATGSLIKPKYSTQIDPAAVIQDAAGAIGQGVQNIFKNLGM